ncbi:hypothetical protein LZB94_09585, partial [Campylobacter coli]|uniref:hypothetical protein n=1 Tax=Campylobacter coli TaxID=195 RepID=UPI001F095E67
MSQVFWGIFLSFSFLLLGHARQSVGIEIVPPVVETHSLNHWTTREVPLGGNFKCQELGDVMVVDVSL